MSLEEYNDLYYIEIEKHCWQGICESGTGKASFLLFVDLALLLILFII